MIQPDKKTLRKTIRQQRRALSRAQQSLAAQRFSLFMMRTNWWRRAERVAFYWPADGELDVLPLLHWSLRFGKRCFLPVINQQHLVFREYRQGIRLRRNRFGIPEPQGRTTYTADKLDLILLPLVGFDGHCNRLGMGAGFYDCTLASRRHHSPLLVGVAHELQKLARVPTDPWDVALDGVTTDRRVYRRNKPVTS